ncbi:MAG: response regulator [Pseudomonadota bacterium]
MNVQSSERQTILIVDDTPDNIMLLSRLLKDKYHTKVATNGSTALQIAHASPDLDLILLDVMMPGVDGYETCRQLKADPRTANIPVIFLTAKSQIEDEAMGLTMGAVDYLTKPISPPILFARVATQLTLARARQQLQHQKENLERMVSERTAQLIREALLIMEQSRASQPDPAILDAFLKIEQRFAEIAAEFSDAPGTTDAQRAG